MVRILLFFWLISAPALAQYHFTELGARLDAGLLHNLHSQGHNPGAQWKASAFFSHFFCGKNYGYQLEGGAFVGLTDYTPPSPTIVTDKGTEVPPGQQYGGHIAALWKMRVHNYHRDKEWFFLIGPRFVLQTDAQKWAFTYRPNGATQDAVFTLTELPLSTWLSLSGWRRLPMGSNRSWLVGGGIDFSLTPIGTYQREERSTAEGARAAVFWFGGGLTLWNNR